MERPGGVGGGRCWFVVDSKSFEILINSAGGSFGGSFWREVKVSPIGLGLEIIA